MTSTGESTSDRLKSRAGTLGLVATDATVAGLAAYYDLLQRWNETINLTSLGDTDDAIDRLIMEPLVASKFLPRGGRIVDVGSGGGSPAIPLAIALGSATLVMVESRGRKAAFLREALRLLEIAGRVETDRAETLADRPEFAEAADIVSMRAVRMTSQLSRTLSKLLARGGVLAVFSRHSEPIPQGFKAAGAHLLIPATQSFLHRFSVD